MPTEFHMFKKEDRLALYQIWLGWAGEAEAITLESSYLLT